MSLGHTDVKRQGSPKAVDEEDGYFIIRIPLNIRPDNEWIECFKNPSRYKPNEAHPKLVEILGKFLEFRSRREKIKENIKWIDDYISQANNCYHRKMAKKEEERRKREEKLRNKKEKLEEISRMLEKL